MKKIITGLMFLAISGSGFLFNGCMNLDRTSINRNRFVIDISSQSERAEPQTGKTLKVRTFNISNRFNCKSLVYKTGPASYQSDFYNSFLISPEEMITENTISWLRKSGLFASIPDISSKADADLLMEGDIEQLYGDFSDSQKGRSIMKIEFFLLDYKEFPNKIVFQKSYNAVSSLEDNSAEELIKGYEKCLTQILQSLEKDLAENLAKK